MPIFIETDNYTGNFIVGTLKEIQGFVAKGKIDLAIEALRELERHTDNLSWAIKQDLTKLQGIVE